MVTGFPLHGETCCNCTTITINHFCFGHSRETLFQGSCTFSQIKTNEDGCLTTAQVCLQLILKYFPSERSLQPHANTPPLVYLLFNKKIKIKNKHLLKPDFSKSSQILLHWNHITAHNTAHSPVTRDPWSLESLYTRQITQVSISESRKLADYGPRLNSFPPSVYFFSFI